MLNYETLLSSYDDKLTLLQWLKKVEAALNDASAVSFDVVNLGNATFKFKIVFEDGSEIESNPLVVNQGDSVASAAIVNGHLILTLTNGDTIDAGSMFDGNVNITGTLTCAGDVLINADLTAGEIVGSKVSSTGLLTASGNATFTSDISVGGDAAITGTITGGEIVENMTGYTFEATPTKPAGVNITYASVVKNGNKITFAVALSVLLSSAISTGEGICYFFIPAEIGAKLFPFTSGGANYLDVKGVEFAIDGVSTISAKCRFLKNSDTTLLLNVRMENFAAGTQYYGRYECTFLLNDNMAA